MTGCANNGLIDDSVLQIWRGITSFASKLLTYNFSLYNDIKDVLSNFKAVYIDEAWAELYILKVKQLDTCIFFTNPVTYELLFDILACDCSIRVLLSVWSL